MRRRVSIVLLLLLGLAARAQTNVLPFPVGEETFYDLHWGMLPVGESHITTGLTNHQGRTVLAIRYFTRTNKLVETLYPVSIQMETLIDPDTFLPIRFTKKAQEGRRRTDEVTDFNHAAGTATVQNRLKNKTKVVPIQADTRDLVALMYHMRGTPFVPGSTRQYQVFTDDKIYDLTLKMGAVEKVSLSRYGKVDSVKVDPEAAFNGLFVRKGKLEIWVSNDDRRICTRIVGEVPVASVHIVLREVRGPGTDRWVKPAGKGE